MVQFLKNEWVIGIITGTISGIILNVVPPWIVNKKKKSEYKKQIKLANQEVISLLTPYIVDKGLPEERIINAIINTVARKLNIQIQEMYSVEFFCEELIGTIIENVYISNEQKEKYTKGLAEYLNNLHNKLIEDEVQQNYEELYAEQQLKNKIKRKLNFRYFFTIEVFTLILTFISVSTNNYELWVYPFNKYPVLILIVSIVFVIVLINHVIKFKRDI